MVLSLSLAQLSDCTHGQLIPPVPTSQGCPSLPGGTALLLALSCSLARLGAAGLRVLRCLVLLVTDDCP